MWTTYDNSRASAVAGTLRLYVWHVGVVKDEDGGVRKRYDYRISDDNLNTIGHEAYDLYSGVGADVDPHHALTTLVASLSAASEGIPLHDGPHAPAARERDLFPEWVNEVAYMNDTELTELALDLEEGAPATGSQARSIIAPEPAPRGRLERLPARRTSVKQRPVDRHRVDWPRGVRVGFSGPSYDASTNSESH